MTVRSAIASALRLLSRRDRRLLGLSVLIQMATSALDLVGVLLIGLVAALSVTTVQSQPPPALVTSVAEQLGLGGLTAQQLVIVFAAMAASVLLGKSVVSSYLTRRVFMFLANRQALVSARLTRELLSMPLTFVQTRSSQETAYALISGAGAATMSVLGQAVIAATELALLLVLAVALVFINPIVAVASVAFFALVAMGLQKAMGDWATRVGIEAARSEIASLDAVQEALSAYREITVANRRVLYSDRIQALRWQAARVAADSQFIGMLPKYLFEAALVVGGFALALFLFATQDSAAAVGTFALFLAAATRVMPSLLRLQGATIGLRGAAGSAAPTFELAADLDHPTEDMGRSIDAPDLQEQLSSGYDDFEPRIELTGISFTYPGEARPALDDVSLSVSTGDSVALVGPSGAGKSTLADVLLGVLHPSKGLARLGGVDPMEAVLRWPGAIAYVPQSVTLANATVRENVALGLPREAIDDAWVWQALDRAHLGTYLRQSRDGLDTHIGERGVTLSGGQRQRLGIARALYTRPRLLVLDEATSALDAETEQAITNTIDELSGQVTTVIIAHRLSTVRNAQVIVYLEQGSVKAAGTFEQVRNVVPAFDRQAALMGLA